MQRHLRGPKGVLSHHVQGQHSGLASRVAGAR